MGIIDIGVGPISFVGSNLEVRGLRGFLRRSAVLQGSSTWVSRSLSGRGDELRLMDMGSGPAL